MTCGAIIRGEVEGDGMSQTEQGQAPKYDPDRYDTVESRIESFYEEHPDGRIDTSLLSDPNDVSQCLFLAAVYLHKDDAAPRATGHAQ